MAVTLQNVIDWARKSLNDDDKARWPDAEMLVYANDGLNEVWLLRPDLFIGQYTTFAGDGTLAAGATLPIDARFSRVLADYLIHRAHLKDDEASENGRAAAYRQFFEGRLKA